jgi:nitrogen fixation NifU-like protein
VSALRAVVLEHFRHPRNRGPLVGAEASVEGANPLCGDRVRIELRAEQGGGTIADARFTADACALCVASASLLTERVRGMRLDVVQGVDERWLFASLEGEPPPARRKCATLPLDTLHRAAASLSPPPSAAQ